MPTAHNADPLLVRKDSFTSTDSASSAQRTHARTTSKQPVPPPILPRIFTFEQSAASQCNGYPIYVKKIAPQEPTHLHEHVYHEIALIESGSADHFSSEGHRKLFAGDILIIKPRVWHQYLNTKNLCVVNCLFDRRILNHQKVFLNLVGSAFELFRKPTPNPQTTPPVILHASPAQRQLISDSMHTMIRELNDRAPDHEAALVVNLLNVILTISRIHQGTHPTAPSGLTPEVKDQVNAIVTYLENHFREQIALQELSQRFHVSTSYLSRIFSRQMGMGIIDYIHFLRIEEACFLLRHSDWSISRIAGEVGYDEIPYFSRRFRRETGKAPSQYRETPST